MIDPLATFAGPASFQGGAAAPATSGSAGMAGFDGSGFSVNVGGLQTNGLDLISLAVVGGLLLVGVAVWRGKR